MDKPHLKLVRDFCSLYNIEMIDNSAFVLTSSKEKLFVRTHLIDPQDTQIHEQVQNLLDMHLSLNQQYVAPLLHFQICQEGIRAFYKMDKRTLREQIRLRVEEQRHFLQQELWVLLSSLVDSLYYLQQKGITYGVLSSSKIFLQEKIRLMDPSAYNLAPINASRLSYHSPEIHSIQSQIDFNQSDVYLLGLSLLQAASLTPIFNNLSKQLQSKLISQVSNRYSSEIVHVLNHLLSKNPQQRPTFKDIKQYIETQIQIKGLKCWQAEPLEHDLQDEEPCEVQIFSKEEQESIDILQPNFQFAHSIKLSEHQQAKNVFLNSPLKYPKKQRKRLSTTKSSTKQSSCETKLRYDKRNDENTHSVVEEFKIQLGETINRSKKLSRAVQIKNRNAQQVKRLQSLHIEKNGCTNPALMSIIQFETQRALKYLHLVNPTS